MDDKTQSVSETDEYKFSESEGEGITTNPSPGDSITNDVMTRFNLKNINWNRVAVFGGLVLAVLVVYEIFSFYSTRKNNETEERKVADQAIAVQRSLTTSPESLVSQQATSIGASQSHVDDQIAQLQTTVQQKIGEVVQGVSGDREQIANLNDTISKVQQNVSDINQGVEQLTDTVQQTLAAVQALKAQKAKPKKKVTVPPVAYHIRAIVPGRVWLESNDGRNVTLRVGNSLEGYGVVEVISPRDGMVVMSNGSIIQYGINDF